MPDDSGDERGALLECLDYQRTSVLSIVDGLEEEAWHSSVVPSGWTVAGLVEHLGGAERHWFQWVLTGSLEKLPWDDGLPDYDPNAALTCDRPSGDIVACYRQACRRSDENLSIVSMASAPLGHHGGPDTTDETFRVRGIVLHMIEETAAHSGHLEIARELLDGRTKMGLR